MIEINKPEVYSKYIKKSGNVHLAYYMWAADELGIKYDIFAPGIVTFNQNDRFWTIWNGATDLSTIMGKYFSVYKNKASKIFTRNSIPVPDFKECLTADDALQFYREHKKIVIKPVNGLGGKGITLLPDSEKEVIEAFNTAQDKCAGKTKIKVMVEKFFEAQHYRLLVLGDRVIAAVHRKPAYVIGNGKQTVQELIEQQNGERKSRKLMAIPLDSNTKKKLDMLGMNLSTIPEANKQVYVRLNANLSTGGTTEECLSLIPQEYLDLAVKAVHSLGLRFGGVDLMAQDVQDPTKPHAINEVNHYPGLRVHYKVDKGKVTDVATEIMKYMAALTTTEPTI